MSFIYVIKNDVNDKVYVGKTDGSIERRFQQHCQDSKKDSIKNRPLYYAIRKYGIEHFFVEELEECKQEDASALEIYYINLFQSYKNGYNATRGEEGKTIVDYNKVLSLFQSDKNLTCKQIAKKCNCHPDTVSYIIHQKIKNVDLAKRYIESENFFEPKSKIKSKPVLCIEKNKKFLSTYDAEKWLISIGRTKTKGSRSHISQACKENRKTAYGFHWQYVD